MTFTSKQKRFISAYLNKARGNATEAARVAGYAHPDSSASDLMRPGSKVREEIDRRLDESFPSESEMMARLGYQVLISPGDEWVSASDQRRAIELVYKLRGKVTDRVSVTVDGPSLLDLLNVSPDDDGGDE